MYKDILKSPLALVGLIMIIIIMLVVIFAPLIAPNDPMQVDPTLKFQERSEEYPLGTDNLGRCTFSRLIYATRTSMSIALPILVVLIIISIILSMIAGYYSGWFDKVMEIICNAFMAFPPIAIVLSLIGALGQGIFNLAISIIISSWVWYIRIIRNFILTEMAKPYIVSAKISGCSDIKIMVYHILPNIIPQCLVFFSTGVAGIILMISGFAFLGIGIEPGIAEWGAMLNSGKSFLYSNPELILYPGICILFTATAFNLFGESLRDILSKEEQ